MENDRNVLNPLFSNPTKGSVRPVWTSAFTKRLADILASGLGLLLLSPVFALIGIMLRREAPGPVFYRGRRMGRDGVEFGILKFRTMREEEASYQGPS